MKLTHRLVLASPLIGLTGLTFGVALIGALGLWSEYTIEERTVTAFLCLITGLSFGVSVSIVIDRRINDVPWMRIATIVIFLLLSVGLAIARRSLILEGL